MFGSGTVFWIWAVCIVKGIGYGVSTAGCCSSLFFGGALPTSDGLLIAQMSMSLWFETSTHPLGSSWSRRRVEKCGEWALGIGSLWEGSV